MNFPQPEYEDVVECRLRDVVGATLDRHRAHPSEAVPLDEAFGRLIASMNADGPGDPQSGHETSSVNPCPDPLSIIRNKEASS